MLNRARIYWCYRTGHWQAELLRWMVLICYLTEVVPRYWAVTEGSMRAKCSADRRQQSSVWSGEPAWDSTAAGSRSPQWTKPAAQVIAYYWSTVRQGTGLHTHITLILRLLSRWTSVSLFPSLYLLHHSYDYYLSVHISKKPQSGFLSMLPEVVACSFSEMF